MDITVSRLNERVALRVPSELPLGLVFIVGHVEAMRPYAQAPDEVTLRLADGDHSLLCRLPRQVAEEMQLTGNERVRAGGHLVFDTREARYYLLARDIEVLAPLEHDEDTPLPPSATAPVDEPVGEEPLVRAELPPWVRQLAPPEVRLEADDLPAAAAESAPLEEETIPLPPALVDYLSQAIDSEQEIELTPTLFHQLMERYDVESPAVLARAGGDEQAEESAAVEAAGEEKPAAWEAPSYADADDDAVPASELPAGPAEEPAAARASQRPQPSPQRQALLLVGGVLALSVVILLVFVAIALALGYTPSLFP